MKTTNNLIISIILLILIIPTARAKDCGPNKILQAEVDLLLKRKSNISLPEFVRAMAKKSLTIKSDKNKGKVLLTSCLRGISSATLMKNSFQLNKQTDTARHFIGGIGLGLTFDFPAAYFIVEQKENTDAFPGGSGFDFNDVAASCFGIYLAEAARKLNDRESLVLLRKFSSGAITFSQLCPPVKLPHLPAMTLPDKKLLESTNTDIKKLWKQPAELLYRLKKQKR